MLSTTLKRISAITVFFISLFCFFTSAAQNYPAVLDQNTLNGKNGFIVTGLNAGDAIGTELSFVGDINNDGLEDIAINTMFIKLDGVDLRGTTYIIFGSRNTFPSPFDLTTLNGTNGFKVVGIAEDERRGSSIGKLGDINGDGIDDISLSSEGNKHMFLYGRSGAFPASLSISDIDGANGFIFTQSGVVEIKSAGDVNGDGRSDIVMGQSAWSGESYVIFGRNGNFPLNINNTWLDGTNGFRLGSVRTSRSAFYVGTAGDINKDGYSDLIVGVWKGSGVGQNLTYVYFGHAGPFTSLVDLQSVNGTNGFSIENNSSNFLVPVGTLGDINDDGIDDFFSGNNIIFGSSTPGAFTNNLTVNGTNGFNLTGYIQTSAAIGDINRDGINDFIVVANGENWVIFGSTQPFLSTFDTALLDGISGFKIKNLSHSNIGRQVSGNADVNGDGFPDFMLSSSGHGTGSSNGGGHGIVYVVFSGDHFAKPLTTDYPKAINIASTRFALEVNATEKGKVYYAVYPGAQAAVTSTTAILNGTGALQSGSIAADQLSTSLTKNITGLSPLTKYDVYLYFEDVAGNKTGIYKLDDVTTLAGDTQAPVIECPVNGSMDCDGVLPDYTSTIVVSDNGDVPPTVTQSPSAGTVVNANTSVTITATDNFNNTSTCTFPVIISNMIYCQADQTTGAASLAMPDYTKGRSVSGFCSAAPHITQTPAPGTIIRSNAVVTLTATAGNIIATCSFTLTVNGSVTSTESAADNTDLIVYPNPAKDVVYIKGSEYDTYEVIDNLGSVILQGKNETEINVANIAQGMYLILFYNQQHQVVAMKKIIKN